MAVDYDRVRDRDRDDTDIRGLVNRGASADVDETDTGDGWQLQAETLTGDETVVVLPAQKGEFTCVSCFLVKNHTQFDHDSAAGPICRDCAADF